MAPPPKLTISEWADAERYLSPEASAEPGRWDTSRAEYLREIMDAVGDPLVTRVVVTKAAQVGWTEVINNAAAFYMTQDPAPILVIQPTGDMAEAWSKDRLAPMLRDTPALRNRVRDPRSRDSGNTILQKLFPGGHLTMIGANAPAGLASRPIRIVLADEVNRYPVSAGTEGDPLALAAKRQTTFWNRKTLIGSTPTRKGACAITREFEHTDKRRYHVPCPHCAHPQTLRWEQVKWDKDEDGTHRPETASYLCESAECGTLWSDADRWDVVRLGKWKAGAPFAGVAGFHIPGFLSSWLTLEEIVREFLKVKNDPALLQVWVNTVLGEPWEETGESVDGDGLIGRTESYDHLSLPEWVQAVTAGVDTQGDRLEVQLIGWGAREESWPCRYEIIRGDPAQPQVWDELDEVLLTKCKTTDGRTLPIRAACIDSGGHHAAQVLTYTRSRRARRVFAIKGAAGPRPVWPIRASKAKTNDQVFIVGVDTAKDAIYSRLRIKESGPGFIHFPAADAYDQAYFEQLTAEQAITRFKEGRPYRVWMLAKGRRNEALDTFVYALAAMKSLSLRLEKVPMPEVKPDGSLEPRLTLPPVKVLEKAVSQKRDQDWFSASGGSAAKPRIEKKQLGFVPAKKRRSGWL